MRFIIFFALLTALNLYVFSFFARTGWLKSLRQGLVLRLVFLAFFTIQLFAPLYTIAERSDHLDQLLVTLPALSQASWVALGLFSCLLAYCLAAELVLSGRYVFKRFRERETRQKTTRVLLSLVLLATLATMVYGLYNSHKTEIEQVEIRIKNLPEAFDGLKIVQLSDIHIGPFLGGDYMRKLVGTVQPLKPDLVFLTGDLADARPEDMEIDAAPLGDLMPPLGKYYVTGNHEYYWDASGWMRVAERLGFTVLTNRRVLLEKESASLVLAGVPDPTSRRLGGTPPPDVAKTLEGVADGLVRILIAHQPVHQDEAIAARVSAYFCGHTHGGQYFPYTLLFAPFLPARLGLQDIEGMKLYVNRGTGFWGPPLRTNGKGEITLITLRRE